MTESTRTYKPGDVLTLKVPVTQGHSGPIIRVGNLPIMVPGHKKYPGGVLSDQIVDCTSPLRVGDRVTDVEGYARKGTIKAIDTDKHMVKWDHVNCWYPYNADQLRPLD